MPRLTKSSLTHYAIAILSVIAAALLTSSLAPLMPRGTFIFFILAVLLSAWRGGHGPGLVATVLSALLVDYFFLPPFHTLGLYGLNRMLPIALFISAAFLISIFTSELTRAREGLSETSETLEAIVQASPLAIVAINADLTIKIWNLAAERMFGWSSDEVIGKPIPYVPQDKLEEYRAFREEALRSEGFITREARRMRKDGSFIDVRLSIAVVHDAKGRYSGTMAVIADITENKQAKEQLERLATAVEQAAESIVITDAEGIIQYVNPAFERTSGYSRQEAIGQNPRLLKSGKQDSAFYTDLWQTITRGEVWTGHLTNKRKDGTLFEEEATISPVRDGSGKIINFVAVERDVTKEVGLENQLIQAQKMEAIGTLAGGIAHDFNNLLTAIIGYSQLVAHHLPEGDKLRTDIEEIEKAGQRAASLTSQLLAFSRKQVFQPKALDLNALVTELKKMLRRLIGEDIDLVAVLDLDLGQVNCDPGQLQQVIMNLVVNARDAMPHGGKLTIETANVNLDSNYAFRHIGVTPGEHVMLAVTDTGCGMDQETQSHIFEPFFTTKERGRGTGLGLSTVYGIVKQSGGYVWVYSEPGRGSSFKIYLPRIAESVEEEATHKELKPLPRGTETLLLVEDEDSVRDLAARVLRGQGYKVLEASNGSDALRTIHVNSSDEIPLLVTDVVMPNMGGWELVKEMLQSRPDLRVLYVSGYTDAAIVNHGVLHENTPFLQKPFTPEALVCKVRDVLDAPKHAVVSGV